MCLELEKAIEVIEYLSNKGYIILGGDVFLETNGKIGFSPGGESWYTTRDENQLPTREAILFSANKAMDYITMFYNRNGDYYYYSIVFVTPEGLNEIFNKTKIEEMEKEARLKRKYR